MKLGYWFAAARTKIYLAFYSTVLYRLGFGYQKGKTVWDEEYKGGTWNFLHSEDEIVHYNAIIARLKKGKFSSILDIGCGEGVLYDYFKKFIDTKFTFKGIDISKTAIENAQKAYPGVDFETVDFDYEKIEGKFDLIIINEVLYLFLKPMKMLAKAFADNVAEGGSVLISMVDEGKGRHDIIWKNIESEYKVLHSDMIKNSKGWTWTIKTITRK